MLVDEVIDHQETVEEVAGDEILGDMQAGLEEIQGEEADQQVETPAEKMVPLSAVLKERKKRQELEMQTTWQQQQLQQYQQQQIAPVDPVDDSSKYETVTREEQQKAQNDTIRTIEERQWMRDNPEKMEILNEHLKTFLDQRPNLKSAIRDSGNRYEEAFTLMNALTPRQQQQLKTASAQPKKPAPNSPASMPKSAALNHAVDVMKMSDKEYLEWRGSKRKSR